MQMWRGVERLRIIKDKKAATVIPICIKEHNSAKKRDLGLTSAR